MCSDFVVSRLGGGLRVRAMKWLHIACVPLATAFYLPGVAPIEYEEGAAVELKVNKLTSSKTQLPYEYYTLPYCKPDTVKKKVENIGEILTGDIIETSPYEIYMLQQESCKTLCTVKLKPKGNREKFRNMIEEEYVVNMIVDNLPAAVAYQVAVSWCQHETRTHPCQRPFDSNGPVTPHHTRTRT